MRDKRVLITGASSGVGAAAADEFARAGAHVALVARSRAGLEKSAERARRHGVRAEVVVADLGEPGAPERAVAEAVERLGGLDVLVLNHAAAAFGPFEQVPPEAFDRTVAVSFTGTVDTLRAALPHLDASDGAVVATGSLMSKMPLPTWSSYSAAKHGLRGLFGSLRAELRAEGSSVSVSIVHPGAITTPLWHGASSATGLSPRHPPWGYSAQTIARGLVAAAERPRPEFTLGGEARLLELLFALARPVADVVLSAVHIWYTSGRRPAPEPGSLWQPTGDGAISGRQGIERPSLWGVLRLGPRLLPDPLRRLLPGG